MYPACDERNLTPSSICCPSYWFTALGVPPPAQMLTEPDGAEAWVVNVQLKSAARGLPATSVTPPSPPLIVAVYAVE